MTTALRDTIYAPKCYWTEQGCGAYENGCGPKGLGWLIRDNYLGLALAEPCNIHDICYDFLGNGDFFGVTPVGFGHRVWIETRAQADRLFFHNLRVAAAGCGLRGWMVRNAVAPIMWGAVRVLGWLNC